MKNNAEATERICSVVCCILLIAILRYGYGIEGQDYVALL